jgi:hypothetical protein
VIGSSSAVLQAGLPARPAQPRTTERHIRARTVESDERVTKESDDETNEETHVAALPTPSPRRLSINLDGLYVLLSVI